MGKKQLIGARIKHIRNRKGVTQERLSEQVDISPKYLSSIERGKENPTLNTILALADALEVDLGEIFVNLEAEDASKRKKLITSLLKDATDEEMRVALKVLLAVLR